MLEAETSYVVDPAVAARFLDSCVAERLSMGEDGRYLSLALPARHVLARGSQPSERRQVSRHEPAQG